MSVAETDEKRRFALEALSRLREAGHQAYWAGGCVRDWLLGMTPKDYDIATNATPRVVRKLFGRRRTLAVGEAFGVVIVVGPRGAGQVEVATFRSDGTYSDGRHPDSVTFGTAEEDVRRRDFTINGMLYDPLEDRVLDFVGGRRDLEQGVVRAIGDARQRFAEDKLRTLRAVRFAARFGYELEAETRRAVIEMAPEITVVAAERIAQEMRAMLAHPSRAEAARLCLETGLFAVILPEVVPLTEIRASEGNGRDLWQITLEKLPPLPEDNFSVALAALLSETSAESAAEICARWRLSNAEADRVVWLLENRLSIRQAPQMPWSQLQPTLIAPGIEDLLILSEADCRAWGQPTEHITYCREKLRLPPEELDPPPLLTGHDLHQHGIPQGKIYSRLLAEVRTAQLDGKVRDKQQALALVDELRDGLSGRERP